jgi:D-arabinose 1-dehydrogenase-like Zn-dependent alcohol dehydrogenase
MNETVVVVGAGGVGQVLIQLFAAGGARVVAADVNMAKREKALSLGASIAVDPAEADAVRQIQQLSDGGAECAINCAGSSASMRFAADAVMRCGRIVVVGEEPQDPRIDTIEIAQKELEIIGSRNGTEQDMVDAVRLVSSGIVHPVIAARYPLEQINAAFDHMRQGAMGRVVVVIKD